ncbi:unnamed protein product, partial [Mesorhabditis belari]|uniref:CUB domain-containing protein n=1 Tax=Mesorhabditis belari TaxID=2138241 RepID=A0AAF3J6Z5_9BILA
MSTEYPNGIRQPSRFPGAVLTLDFPKNCSQMFCGWKPRENMKIGQEIDFSFLGNYEPKDRFYIRNSTGTMSLLPEFGPFKRFKMMINEPFIIYFVGSDQPKNDRHLSLQFAYEANI